MRPGMVGTDQQIGVTFTFYQLMGAVLADVVKSFYFIVLVFYTEQGFACDVETKIVASVFQLGHMSRVLPGTSQNAKLFCLVNRRIRVIPRIE